ncbi:sufE-like protein 2, chloroplastic isoform X2 [Diospyros lotus]|uniref:sufE-like protein 2, chloroplastic isoform X1 n=1 Tax=Diospyros lotus TaxID=55363 RepID=UPI0022534612|nr:sufE-like protein 2, chloroplastic isoform X1 [Diospyros lotus]XP_052204290.1 sufE-like protein 2, chloroplastic isoform X2 [Diospyros lotus]
MTTTITLPSFRSHFPSFSLHPNMNSATLKSPPCPKPSRWVRFRPKQEPIKQLKCFHSSVPESGRLHHLVSEFKALPEPIDRVKRLLRYAEALPRLDESGRVEVNRVPGCAAQVWVEARMDSNGLMRFRADSDSEISKGFCSCLIWVLDGAPPEAVAAVAAEDLAEVHVGLSGRTPSRVNTWQNVLVSMQKRTRLLVEQRRTAVAIDEIASEGIHGKTQERFCTPGVVQLS